MEFVSKHRNAQYKPGLAWFSIFALVWVGLLLFAGGFTTSIDAGMAFLDWPLSNGSINPEGWLQDSAMRAEHSHRLLGMKVGFLSIILLVWTWIRESRPALRRLAALILLMVILQGILGGGRVLFDRLNIGTESNLTANVFAVLHACGAQIILCLLVAFAWFSSRSRFRLLESMKYQKTALAARLGWLSCLLLLLTILIGAIVRHTNAGMAIYTFPHSSPDGDWLPPFWNWAVIVHFSHRVGALLASVSLIATASVIWGSQSTPRRLKLFVFIPLFLLAVQVFLAVTVINTGINPHAATAHMLTGALLLAFTWLTTLLCLPLDLKTDEAIDCVSENDTAESGMHGMQQSPSIST